MRDRLKSCPFCGGEAELQQIPEVTYDKFVVTCKSRKCCAFYIGYCDEGLYNTKTEAIKGWNTRKPMDRIVEQLEEAKGKPYTDGVHMYNENDFIEIDKAIEIVKEGVKNE